MYLTLKEKLLNSYFVLENWFNYRIKNTAFSITYFDRFNSLLKNLSFFISVTNWIDYVIKNLNFDLYSVY